MRKRRLRTALLVVVAVAVVGIAYLVSQSVVSRRGRGMLELGADFLPEVAQRIQNFHRMKVENGRTMWEITAKEAQYYEDAKEIVVREPRMTFFVKDGERQVHVTGAEGRLHLDGRELRSLTLRGGVTVEADDLSLETPEATYDRATDIITAPDVVTLRGSSLDVRGRGMELEVGPQHVRLLDEVHTVVRPNAEKS
jgi:LPS export ABC transporter protein LptC